MKKQEVFNIVARHLLSQEKRSLLDEDTCAYRGDNNLKCAIGALIPDDLYSESIEKLPVGLLFYDSRVPKNLIEFMGKNFCGMGEFLHDLQRIHDKYKISEWRETLNTLAKQYELTGVEALGL